VFGLEVGLHYSWFLIALLITMSLSAQFQATHSADSGCQLWNVAM
jgi:hypothetical protein